jgi:acyl-CoA dehydrogenase
MIPIEEFQRLARDFLDGHAARRPPRATGWGEGSDDVGVIREAPAAEDRAALVTARWWRAEVFDGGFGWINGPRRYGGMELSNQHVRAWARLEAEYETPSQHHLGVGLGMVGPTILDCGTQVQRDRYLRAIHRGDLIACQLFSEPGAGSDLASIDTRAEQVGGAWVINGHKVWTSSAHVSDIGEIICRTDPSAAKHDGLTAFLVDMRTPGVEV